jgi:hypothetical protein
MKTLSLWMQMSLDGYAEGPNHTFDWPVVEEELQQYFLPDLQLVDSRTFDGAVVHLHYRPAADR